MTIDPLFAGLPRRPRPPSTPGLVRSLCLAGALACSASTMASPPDPAPLTVVRVMAQGSDGRTGMGSGVPIDARTVVTNCHVTRRASALTVLVGDGPTAARFPVQSQAGDVRRDLCVLRTGKRLPVRPAVIGAAPAVGDRVLALGFTGGFNARAHAGVVVARYPLDGGEVLRTATAFGHGSSGGGLFNAAHELVGLLTFHDGGRDAQFYSLPVAWIAAVLSDRPFRPVAPLTEGRAFWEEALEDQPAFLRANALMAGQ